MPEARVLLCRYDLISPHSFYCSDACGRLRRFRLKHPSAGKENYPALIKTRPHAARGPNASGVECSTLTASLDPARPLPYNLYPAFVARSNRGIKLITLHARTGF